MKNHVKSLVKVQFVIQLVKQTKLIIKWSKQYMVKPKLEVEKLKALLIVEKIEVLLMK